MIIYDDSLQLNVKADWGRHTSIQTRGSCLTRYTSREAMTRNETISLLAKTRERHYQPTHENSKKKLSDSRQLAKEAISLLAETRKRSYHPTRRSSRKKLFDLWTLAKEAISLRTETRERNS